METHKETETPLRVLGLLFGEDLAAAVHNSCSANTRLPAVGKRP